MKLNKLRIRDLFNPILQLLKELAKRKTEETEEDIKPKNEDQGDEDDDAFEFSDDNAVIKTEEAFKEEASFGKHLVNLRDFPNKFDTTYGYIMHIESYWWTTAQLP